MIITTTLTIEIHRGLKMLGLILDPFGICFIKKNSLPWFNFWFLQIYHFSKCTPKYCLLGHLMTTAINHTINNPTNLNQICHTTHNEQVSNFHV